MVREFTGAIRPPVATAPGMTRAEFIAERTAKILLSDQQGQFLDKSLMTLSGGGLALALTFLHDHSAKVQNPNLAYAGVATLLVSLLSVLGSLYLSQHSISRHVDALDGWCREAFVQDERLSNPVYENRWARATRNLNFLSGLAFLAGVLSLSAFVMCNLNLTT
jgi:hypothetical protein